MISGYPEIMYPPFNLQIFTRVFGKDFSQHPPGFSYDFETIKKHEIMYPPLWAYSPI